MERLVNLGALDRIGEIFNTLDPVKEPTNPCQ